MKQNVKNIANVKNEVAKVEKINLEKFAEKLQKIEVKEKVKKESLYIYPENFSAEMINSKEGKQFRNKQRNILQRFCNNIFVYSKSKDVEKLKKEIESFISFYKATYSKNDFTVNSLTNKNEEKNKDIVLMLEIVKEVKQ